MVGYWQANTDIELLTDPDACMMYIVSPLASDVNKDWTCKDKDKDQAYKDQDKDKDRTCKDKGLNLILKESLRTRVALAGLGGGIL